MDKVIKVQNQTGEVIQEMILLEDHSPCRLRCVDQ
jgi:hypothetical protein